VIIYLDESGDLGLDFSKARTTRKFVITLLVCEDNSVSEAFRRSVRRTLKNKVNSGKKRSRAVEELKGAATTLSIKEYFYRQLPQDGWHIYAVILDKQSLPAHTSKKRLYSFLARSVVERVPLQHCGESVTIVVDRSQNAADIAVFNDNLIRDLEDLIPLDIPVYISHEPSHENAGLQGVDLFSWGIFRKHEAGDTDWYSSYSQKVELEFEYYPQDNKKDGPCYA
jgi:hypothetical protein